MGCVASKLENEEDVVLFCRERKRQLNLALKRRYTLAQAHTRYCLALYAVSAAIRLFVARHATPSQFLVTFPLSENIAVSNPMFLREKPSEPVERTLPKPSTSEIEQVHEEKERMEETYQEKDKEGIFRDDGYFYPPHMTHPIPSPERDFGWDFFNPFYGARPEVIGEYSECLDEDLRAVREKEGIPELEEEDQEVSIVEEANNNCMVVEGESTERGRELLEALNDIEDYFIRACDSENSTKLIQAIAWRRPTLYRSSSRKSIVASNTKALAWKEYKNDIFDDCGGMDSGSHTQTLGRLYAWEKKLYEQVKAGDDTRKVYERKCTQLRDRDFKGIDWLNMEKTRSIVKDLYARILVAVKSAESISKRIQKLRDEELQPQIVELLHGLTKTWEIMLQVHETQNMIMSEVKTFMCPEFGHFCNNSHRLATLQFEAELQNWRARFSDYISAQKSYIEALHGWLIKFIVPEVDFNSPKTYRNTGPNLLIICRDWLASLEALPDKAVCYTIKRFSKDVRTLWLHQGDEQQQKRKVDALTKELERRFIGMHKSSDNVIIDYNHKSETSDVLTFLTRRLDLEKAKHLEYVQETRRITLDGFRMGFCEVFESLSEFSKASLKMYNDLVTSSDKLENGVEK